MDQEGIDELNAACASVLRPRSRWPPLAREESVPGPIWPSNRFEVAPD